MMLGVFLHFQLLYKSRKIMKKNQSKPKRQNHIVNIPSHLWSELKADDASTYKGGDHTHRGSYYILNRDTGTYDII